MSIASEFERSSRTASRSTALSSTTRIRIVATRSIVFIFFTKRGGVDFQFTLEVRFGQSGVYNEALVGIVRRTTAEMHWHGCATGYVRLAGEIRETWVAEHISTTLGIIRCWSTLVFTCCGASHAAFSFRFRSGRSISACDKLSMSVFRSSACSSSFAKISSITRRLVGSLSPR